jgi:predicted dehydrogenase
MKEINWGIIGCGDVTELKSGPAFNKVEGSKLVAVMRRNRSKAEDYARRHHVSRWYDNAEELINDSEVNAIYVATPPQSHSMYAIQAMKAGKPVYVEKPMALNYAECLKMNEVSRETGVPLFVAYYRRGLPYFLKVKELLDNGMIGKPITVNLQLLHPTQKSDYQPDNLSWRVKPEIAGAGYFYDMACHELDILDFILGPIQDAKGFATNIAGLYAAEDTVSASLHFDSGLIGSGNWSFVVPEKDKKDTIEIQGTEGRIEFSSFDFTPILVKKNDEIHQYKPDNPENIQYWLIRSVVESLQKKGICPSDGKSGARTNRVMDKILGKKIVE